MPSIFKALATITAWILFILGLLVIVINFVFVMIDQAQKAFAGPPAMDGIIIEAVGVAIMVLAVVVMKLRHMLE